MVHYTATDKSNAGYFKLPLKHMWIHNLLMSIPMGKWPKELQEFVKEECQRMGVCGEVIACSVAEWMKKELPY